MLTISLSDALLKRIVHRSQEMNMTVSSYLRMLMNGILEEMAEDK